MRLIGLAVILTVSLILAPLAAEAQVGKVSRVGWLQPSQPGFAHVNFRRAMRELGYLEGETVTFDERWAHGRFDRLPGLAEDLVRLNVDVIVAIGTGSIRAAREATRTIPIVMGSGVDPVKAGFVTSLNRPGGNVTGVSILAPEVSAKRLDLLKQALPGITRVGVLGYRTNPATTEQITAIEAVAASLKLTIHPGYVERPGGYAEPFTRFTSERAGAVLVLTTDCRSPSTSATAPRPVASSPMASTTWTSTARRPASSTGSSRAPNPLTCPSSSPRSSSW